MPSDFVHLHVHSDYSMLDGAARVGDLVSQAAEWQMPALACTDHGNMRATVDFYEAAQAAGIKPILGCEFYVAPSDSTVRDSSEAHAQGFHLVLLAEDETGYRNLCKLNEHAWLKGFYHHPRIDKPLLAEHSKGLIAMTACLGGEVPTHLLEGNAKAARSALEDYLDIFSRTHFYIELQDHGLPEQKTVNPALIDLAREYEVPLVATNDSHYLKREHREAHDVLLCIGTQSQVDDEKRMRFNSSEFYFKSPQEMEELFRDYPEALKNTAAIAERCNVTLKLGDAQENHYPVFHATEGMERDAYLRKLCLDAVPERYGEDPYAQPLSDACKTIVERIDHEMAIVQKTGFTSYFLVVWDFLRYARQQGIPVGPGRGSGAGSIIAYLLHITDIDPLEYSLLFERFLNPDRVSPPDFDIDLCERRRGEVIEYVRRTYGADSVAQIGTYGTLKAKAVVKDVARALGRSFDDGNQLTKMIPDDLKMTLPKARQENKELEQRIQKEPWVRELFQHAEVLEGLNRNMSIHAAGVIIGDQPLSNLVPLGRGSNDEVITQLAAHPCEELGLLKMDFLGLRTLTIIQDALDNVEAARGIKMAPSEIPMDDPATFDLLNKGNTVAVFQLESGGMQDLCRRFKLTSIKDIIALIALYRPGPMQFLDEFISRKVGETPIVYDVPAMKPILEETYGIMLYQEQVMQVVQTVAGFSLGQADILRRAMGKKKVKEMEKQYGYFIEGCAERDIDKETAGEIWNKVAKFAEYGFNKSHSAAYAFLSYRTAYLKANYPVEFMAAVLSSELGNADKLRFLIKECRDNRISILPPDVNTSGLRFSVDGDTIRFGLGAIKGVGSAAAEGILAAREKGPFKDLHDFCERVVDNKVNKRVMEALCRCGAFDSFGLRRAQIDKMLDDAIASAQQRAADRAVGQQSLFDLGGFDSDGVLKPTIPDTPEWAEHEILEYEKLLLGFYVTSHPLGRYSDTVETFGLDTIADIVGGDAGADNRGTRVGGLIADMQIKQSRKDGRSFAILTLDGLHASIECLVFADAYEKHGAMLETGQCVFIEGAIQNRDGDRPKIVANQVHPIESVPETFTREVHVHLYEATTGQEAMQQARDLFAGTPGETPVVLCVVCASGAIAFVAPDDLRIRNTAVLRQRLRDLFGEESVVQKPNRERPAVKPRRRPSKNHAAAA